MLVLSVTATPRPLKQARIKRAGYENDDYNHHGDKDHENHDYGHDQPEWGHKHKPSKTPYWPPVPTHYY
ncbi:hypothetical protein B0F90DRAFT_1816313 [Multifurca ochricompacta]|uniref:Uncharacterized protein n=1 Tax=Multifurca ochricompacta TaxID=376703 RepID=A0AAD4QPN2_9AGAM|nr:hypothetical protein B0F90DRAFT_1816313 [Multifurca ochricompacta]